MHIHCLGADTHKAHGRKRDQPWSSVQACQQSGDMTSKDPASVLPVAWTTRHSKVEGADVLL